MSESNGSKTSAAPGERELLGRGRSGTVYRERDASGRWLAAKVFSASGLTRLVQLVLLGTPNPYRWCRAAIEAAKLRRELLAALVRFWFGARLRVARPLGLRWAGASRAWVLETELVEGRHAALSQPIRPRSTEARELARSILRPLRARLREAGLIGMLWQAGEGNPVALNNFMLDCANERSGAQPSWVWIDLESGVPALFSPHPVAWLRYARASWRLGRPLFDDVDTERLSAYLETHAASLDRRLGEGEAARLRELTSRLERAQSQWKSKSRLEQSLECAEALGRIDREQRRWYAQRPFRWYLRLIAQELCSGVRAAAGALVRGFAALWRVDLRAAIGRLVRLVVSAKAREELARRHVEARVRAWRDRKQLTESEHRELLAAARESASVRYLTDFGMHMVIKPFVKTFEWWCLPALYAVGLIPLEVWLVGAASCGSLARTLYTTWRMLEERRKNRPMPWLALFVGVVPVLGNLAFALQLVWTAGRRANLLGRFLIYDACTRIGRALPVWGGADTATEHLANRIGDWVPIRDGASPCVAGLESAELRALSSR